MIEGFHLTISTAEDPQNLRCLPTLPPVNWEEIKAKIKLLVAGSPQTLRLMRSMACPDDVDTKPGVQGHLLCEGGVNDLAEHGGEGVLVLGGAVGVSDADFEVESGCGLLNAKGDLEHGAVSEAQMAPEEQG